MEKQDQQTHRSHAEGAVQRPQSRRMRGMLEGNTRRPGSVEQREIQKELGQEGAVLVGCV